MEQKHNTGDASCCQQRSQVRGLKTGNYGGSSRKTHDLMKETVTHRTEYNRALSHPLPPKSNVPSGKLTVLTTQIEPGPRYVDAVCASHQVAYSRNHDEAKGANLYVRNLPRTMTQEQLMELFRCVLIGAVTSWA